MGWMRMTSVKGKPNKITDDPREVIPESDIIWFAGWVGRGGEGRGEGEGEERCCSYDGNIPYDILPYDVRPALRWQAQWLNASISNGCQKTILRNDNAPPLPLSSLRSFLQPINPPSRRFALRPAFPSTTTPPSSPWSSRTSTSTSRYLSEAFVATVVSTGSSRAPWAKVTTHASVPT